MQVSGKWFPGAAVFRSEADSRRALIWTVGSSARI